MSYALPAVEAPDVVGLEFEDFLLWFKDQWKPGEHVALVGPTGEGKSTFLSQVINQRKYVLAIDAKGGDGTLGKLERFGFQHSEWPPTKEVRKQIEEGHPTRLIVGVGRAKSKDLPRLKGMIAVCLRDAFDEEGWTVYVDETQIVTDQRLMNLRASMERILIAARDRKVSMVNAFQSPSWVPTSVTRQAKWFMVMYTRDRDSVATLAERAGRNRAEMQGMIKALPQYCCLVFANNPRIPVIVTKAPKL